MLLYVFLVLVLPSLFQAAPVPVHLDGLGDEVSVAALKAKLFEGGAEPLLANPGGHPKPPVSGFISV